MKAQVTMGATMSVRMNYGIPHLLAAARFSRRVNEIETANVNSELGEWWDEMRDNAVACLFLISAALESYANELFVDSDKIFPNCSKRMIDIIWDMSERKSPPEKLDLALELRDKPAIDRSTRLFQAMTAAIRLRNELTHFKPEWSHEQDKHVKISDVLRGHFQLNTRHFTHEIAFPNRWAGHSCTSWAVETTVTFLQDFEKLADLPNRTNWAAFAGRLAP